MTNKISHFFWDSCVFIAYLNDEKHAYDISSIEQFLYDARKGDCRIYTSTIALAEVKPSYIVNKSIGTLSDFIDDLSGAVVMIDASANLMRLAGELRDLKYRKGRSTERQLVTPDAIMLASCLHLRDAYDVSLDAMHTFDKGKRRSPEGGKGIPLLTFEEWCDGIEAEALTKRVCNLKRCEPTHPSPSMFPPGAPKK